MAAKLKKRALAEYQSQTLVEDVGDITSSIRRSSSSDDHPRKRLKLVLQSRNSGSVSSRPSDIHLLNLDKSTPNSDISSAIVKFLSRIKLAGSPDLLDALQKLLQLIKNRRDCDPTIKVQAFLALMAILEQQKSSDCCNQLIRDNVQEWIDMLEVEKSTKVVSVIFSLLGRLQENQIFLTKPMYENIYVLAIEKLKDRDEDVKMKALNVLGKSVIHSEDSRLITKCISMSGKYTHSTDPRVRHAAFESLLSIHNSGHKLDVKMFRLFCRALKDDFDCVRLVGLKLLDIMARDFPEEPVKVHSNNNKSNNNRGETLRLVDDAFGKICNAINDLAVKVREAAATLIGNMSQVSPEFLEQTLDKKLMSNMRLKKSAHEREAKMVSSGEWSSGKKWADDAPKEEIEADSVNLMSFGACGAFIHGLEDEFLAVRSASIDALTKLSIGNPKLAALALDFLVDMFNDEIELVRLKAIESLKRIAPHIVLQVHQLETILAALDDYSIVVRERLHSMLQASKIATKDGLQNVIGKLLENLKKYPQDKRSILFTFKRLGEKHSELTLPLVTILLEIHPFFDMAEPDIDDPAYLCILVLVFNAAQHCPTMEPLLDEHTKRHHHFMLDTYPHFMPDKVDFNHQKKKTVVNANTERFLRETLNRIKDSEHLSMANRIKLLQRSSADLERLGSIEPSLADSSKFAHQYLQCQTLFLKTLITRFWTNPKAMLSQQIHIIETNIASLFNLCLQLQWHYTNLSVRQKFQIRLLKIHILALHVLFIVKASNKSALSANEQFLREVEKLNAMESEEEQNLIAESPFLLGLIKKLTEAEDHKPGNMTHIIQPLLLAYPLEALDFNREVSMSYSVIFEPQGMNETPLKYTAGMVLAVPVDCELYNVQDVKLVRVAIKTPDQKIQLVTPKDSELMAKEDEGENCYRLITNALMSHQVWSEALHVEISIVLDLTALQASEGSSKNNKKSSNTDKEKDLIQLCDPVKVYVLPKAIKRGI